MLKHAVICLLAAAAAVQAADYLPLKQGNLWVYQEAGGPGRFEMRVSEPLAAVNGRVYHHLRGYVNEPLWVRHGEDGTLMYYDSEPSQDRPLTMFKQVAGAWFFAPFRPCEQEGQPQTEGRAVTRFGSHEGAALHVLYRTFDCADAGVVEEEYVENIGMVRRTVMTIAGPRTYELVFARLGDLTVTPARNGRFQVELAAYGTGMLVTMRVLADPNVPFTLRFPTSQDYDIEIRDDRGAVVYRWSDGKYFLPSERDRRVEGMLRFAEEIPLLRHDGSPLPPGRYTVEAWLMLGESMSRLAAVAPFEVKPEEDREN